MGREESSVRMIRNNVMNDKHSYSWGADSVVLVTVTVFAKW